MIFFVPKMQKRVLEKTLQFAIVLNKEQVFVLCGVFLQDVVLVEPILRLDNLQPFSNYSFYIIPFRANGAGARSEELIVATLEGGKSFHTAIQIWFCVGESFVFNL